MGHSTTKARRRRPLATVALVVMALMLTGLGYTLVTQLTAHAEDSSSVQTTEGNAADGKKLFQANCATCHGVNVQGTKDAPSLVGVGAAAVSFQVGTGRMPMAMSGPQAEKKTPQFTTQQIADLAAYVQSLAPGPAIPSTKYTSGDGEVAKGGELFRTNCAMCHNVAGAGGALTQGKFAPSLKGVTGEHIYEAMLTGPQNMPVFNDANLTPQDKADVISYLKYIESTPSPGGSDLGSIGPVAEGLFIWIFGIGAIIAFTVWLGARSN